MNNIVGLFINISNKKNLKTILKETGILLGLFIACSAVIFFYDQYGSPLYLKYIVGGIVIIIGIVAYVSYKVKKKLDLETGSPAEDEYTQTVKLHAGNKAYRLSMYFWIAIFVINSGAIEGSLAVSIIGSALIYGICLWYFKTKANFNEK